MLSPIRTTFRVQTPKRNKKEDDIEEIDTKKGKEDSAIEEIDSGATNARKTASFFEHVTHNKTFDEEGTRVFHHEPHVQIDYMCLLPLLHLKILRMFCSSADQYYHYSFLPYCLYMLLALL